MSKADTFYNSIHKTIVLRISTNVETSVASTSNILRKAIMECQSLIGSRGSATIVALMAVLTSPRVTDSAGLGSYRTLTAGSSAGVVAGEMVNPASGVFALR